MRQYFSQILLAALIACLCLGSFVSLPMNNNIVCCMSGVFEMDKENDIPVDSNEFEDDLIFQTNCTTAVELVTSASNPNRLSLQNLVSSPLTPPPEHL